MDRPPPPQPPRPGDAFDHLRSEPRDSMFLLACIRRPSGPEIPVKVRNLSPGGMMAECQSGLMRGEPIEIELRGVGTVMGKVAWTAPGRIGVRFDAPVDHRLARVGSSARSTAQPLLIHNSSKTWRPGVR